MSAWEFLQSNWHEILTLVWQHLVLVLISTSIALAIGLPTGIFIARRMRLRVWVL